MSDFNISSTGSTANTFFPTVLQDIEKSLLQVGYITCPQNEAHTEMELEVVQEVDAEGNVKFYILKAGINKSNLNAQKIKIFAKKKE